MDPPHWSVRAEFHISHPGMGDPKIPAKTDTIQDDSGVKMTYSWDPTEEAVAANENLSNPRYPLSDRGSSASGYVFQRGNICFSSTPPYRGYRASTVRAPNHLYVPESSGYGSDLLSPSSMSSSMKSKDQQGPIGRKCRSTCNIVLSANVQGLDLPRTHCGRTQSLRCQTPSACCERRSDKFYGCGDPWCHHLHYGDEFSRISPVREMCEEKEDYIASEVCTSASAFAPPTRAGFIETDSKRCEHSFDSRLSKVKRTCQICDQTFKKEHNVPTHYNSTDYDSYSQCTLKKESKSGVNNVNKFSEGPSFKKNSNNYNDNVDCSVPYSRSSVHSVNKAPVTFPKGEFKPITELHSLKKDVSVQTYNMVNKCTSPLLKFDETPNRSSKPVHRKGDKLKRGKTLGPLRGSRSPSLSTASSNLRNLQQDLPKKTHSPTFRNTSVDSRDKESPASEGKSSDSSKKPRTIHIDVYCTGTEIESENSDSSDSSRSKSASTPQTVFESDKFCVTHKQAEPDKLPYMIKEKLKTEILSNNTSLEKEDSDLDDTSTAYPSKLSSYSNIDASLSSMSSFPNSLGSYTMSNRTFVDLDSSWKDTLSDISSAMNSRSSIGQTDSIYFVPKKIEEEVEDKELYPEPSDSGTINIHPSDSFEYANSEDRLRIKRMERLWKSKLNPKHSKLPPIKQKLSQQQQSLQDAVKQRLSQMNDSKDTDSEVSDEDEKGWMFVKSDNKSETSGITDETQIDVSTTMNIMPVTNVNVFETSCTTSPSNIGTVNSCKTTLTPSANQIPGDLETLDEAFNNINTLCKSTSSLTLQEKLMSNPQLRSPFTLLPGHYTEPRMIARRFGAVVEAFKKPGHHIGPAKNPNCSCDHCQRHFENSNYRSRACSLDSDRVRNWKDIEDERRRTTYTDF